MINEIAAKYDNGSIKQVDDQVKLAHSTDSSALVQSQELARIAENNRLLIDQAIVNSHEAEYPASVIEEKPSDPSMHANTDITLLPVSTEIDQQNNKKIRPTEFKATRDLNDIETVKRVSVESSTVIKRKPVTEVGLVDSTDETRLQAPVMPVVFFDRESSIDLVADDQEANLDLSVHEATSPKLPTIEVVTAESIEIQPRLEAAEVRDEEIEAGFNQLILAVDSARDEPKPPEIQAILEAGFSEYIEVQPSSDEPVTIETIQITAGEAKPLEAVMAQLAKFLQVKETEQEFSESELVDRELIKDLVLDIEAELPDNYIDLLESDEPVELTPQFTNKVLVLLKTIGYEQPNEVLAEFVTKYDQKFLLQAIDYLSQAASDNQKHELFIRQPSLVGSMRDDNSIRTRWGRAIFSLLRVNYLIQPA